MKAVITIEYRTRSGALGTWIGEGEGESLFQIGENAEKRLCKRIPRISRVDRVQTKLIDEQPNIV